MPSEGFNGDGDVIVFRKPAAIIKELFCKVPSSLFAHAVQYVPLLWGAEDYHLPTDIAVKLH